MRKFLYLCLFLIFAIIVSLFAGRNERVYPEQYSIEFSDLIAQPDDITCGPTSATMLLRHCGENVDLQDVKRQTKTVWFKFDGKDIGMTSPDYIVKALNYFGVSSMVSVGNIHVLKHYVSRGKPCIVLVRSGDTTWHYVVVRGYTKDKISIADPGGGVLYEMNMDIFIGCWSWETDMSGKKCSNFLSSLLEKVEIYPNTFVYPIVR